MKKKLISIISILLMLVSITLVGCYSEEEKPIVPITLKTVSMMGLGDSAYEPYQKLMESFYLMNPQILVDDESELSTEEWKNKVIAQFSEDDTTPDVLFYFTGADAKQLILNDEFVSIEEINTIYPDYAKNIKSHVMDFVKEFDGNHYSVPIKGFWEGLFCNKDLFDKYNIDIPSDWDSFINAILIFKENGIIPIAASLGEIPHYCIEHLIFAEAGAIEQKLNPSGYILDSWVKGLEILKNIYDLGAFPEDTFDISNEDSLRRFINKNAAMVLDGSWISSSVTDHENTVVVPMPSTPTGKKSSSDIISGYSSGYYISKNAWNDESKRDAAVQFVLHMTQDDNISYLCKFGGVPTVDIQEMSELSVFQQYTNELLYNAKNINMPIDSRMNKESWQYLCSQIKPLMLGETTSLELMTQISNLNK